MYSFLLRILLFLSALWLLRRLLVLIFQKTGRKFRGANTPDGSTGLASDTVKDPVCGMYMDPRLALRLDNRKKIIYFCSEECKEKYLRNHL